MGENDEHKKEEESTNAVQQQAENAGNNNSPTETTSNVGTGIAGNSSGESIGSSGANKEEPPIAITSSDQTAIDGTKSAQENGQVFTGSTQKTDTNVNGAPPAQTQPQLSKRERRKIEKQQEKERQAAIRAQHDQAIKDRDATYKTLGLSAQQIDNMDADYGDSTIEKQQDGSYIIKNDVGDAYTVTVGADGKSTVTQTTYGADKNGDGKVGFWERQGYNMRRLGNYFGEKTGYNNAIDYDQDGKVDFWSEGLRAVGRNAVDSVKNAGNTLLNNMGFYDSNNDGNRWNDWGANMQSKIGWVDKDGDGHKYDDFFSNIGHKITDPFSTAAGKMRRDGENADLNGDGEISKEEMKQNRLDNHEQWTREISEKRQRSAENLGYEIAKNLGLDEEKTKQLNEALVGLNHIGGIFGDILSGEFIDAYRGIAGLGYISREEEEAKMAQMTPEEREAYIAQKQMEREARAAEEKKRQEENKSSSSSSSQPSREELFKQYAKRFEEILGKNWWDILKQWNNKMIADQNQMTKDGKLNTNVALSDATLKTYVLRTFMDEKDPLTRVILTKMLMK